MFKTYKTKMVYYKRRQKGIDVNKFQEEKWKLALSF